MGLDMPLPVVICATPGWRLMASMMLVAEADCKSLPDSTATGKVEFFILVLPATPVTFISFSFRWPKNTSAESGIFCAVDAMPRHSINRLENIFFILFCFENLVEEINCLSL